MPTQTQTTLPFTPVLPIATPDSGPEHYQLEQWSERAALQLITTMEAHARNVSSDKTDWRGAHLAFIDAQFSIELAAREALLRFPHTPDRERIEWRIALSDAILGTRNKSPDTRILTLLEAGLNDGRYTPDTLDAALNPHGFEVWKSLSAPNLFGDGQTVPLVLVSTTQDKRGDGLIIALRYTGGRYTPVRVDSFWNFGWGGYQDMLLEELTGDSIPEIIALPHSHNGSMCHTAIKIWQWQKDHFADLTDEIRLRECGATWRIGTPDRNKFPTIETVEGLYPGLVISKTYHWNGTKYELSDILSPPPQELNNYSINWIDIIGHYTQVSDASLAKTIERALLSWPIDGAESLSPSYPDYLRFRLGMLYVSQSQTTQARTILQTLADQPMNPITPTISLAAQVYLEHYKDTATAYRACSAALAVIDDGPLSSPHPICDPHKMLRVLVAYGNKAAPVQVADLPDFLRQAGVPIYATTELYLDDDDKSDWIALVETFQPGQEPTFNLWAFLNTENGIVPEIIASHLAPSPPPNTLSVATFNPQGNKRPVHFLHLEDRLFILQVARNDDQINIQRWLSMELQSVKDYNVRQDRDSFELDVSFDLSVNPRYSTATYRWDAETGYFLLTQGVAPNNLGIPLEQATTQAETLLLTQDNPLAAIPLLLAILDEPKQEYEAFSRARLCYLLGIAYERIDDDQNAIDVYWRLWRDYPDTPYAFLARAKLKPTP